MIWQRGSINLSPAKSNEQGFSRAENNIKCQDYTKYKTKTESKDVDFISISKFYIKRSQNL